MIDEYRQQAYDADFKESELKIVEEELQKMESRRIQELGITCESSNICINTLERLDPQFPN